MTISKQASKLSLPQSNPGVATILEYLIIKFPLVDVSVWQQRMRDGKVHYHDGSLITAHSPFKPQERVYYYREVEQEPKIPFKESIVFQDQHILIAYKPHFLPVTPGGIFVNECLQQRLRESTGIDQLQTLHRLDRVTAGLVMFSVNPETRHQYHELFKQRQITKTYQAIAKITQNEALQGKQWQVKNCIVQGEPRFTMRINEQGASNSHSIIRCVQQLADKALFELSPITGRTHQLRVHMQSIGLPILNDKYYPQLQPFSADNFTAPLQLLAKTLSFNDPLSGKLRAFNYQGNLELS